MQADQKKIFCIGFNKTGTTTIKRCYTILELGSIAPTGGQAISRAILPILNRTDYGPALKLAEKFTCFKDRPWNIWEMYRQLDRQFPNARFILTVRNSESWWKSVERWISITKPWMAPIYRHHLRAADLSKQSMILAYERHNQEIISYFRGTDKLLVIKLEDNLEWTPICRFFDRAIPQEPFPHANKQTYNEKDSLKARKTLKNKPWGRGKLKNYAYYLISKLLRKKTTCFYCDEMAIYNHPSQSRYDREFNQIIRDLGRFTTHLKKAEHIKSTRPIHLKNKCHTDDMAAVCAFIDPGGSRYHENQYDLFYQNITRTGLKLLTIEFVMPGSTSRLKNRYNNVIPINGFQNLWCKEHLLNIGIQQLLHEGYKKIVLLDPAIVADDTRQWMGKIAKALDDNIFVQVYSVLNKPKVSISYKKTIAKTNRGRFFKKGCRFIPSDIIYGYAARAELFKKILLYDRALYGRGTAMVFAASFGYSDEWIRIISQLTYHHVSSCAYCRKRRPAPLFTWHFIMWAQDWARHLRGNVGFIDQEITLPGNDHHAEFEKSAFLSLLKHEYDPSKDITAINEHMLQWTPEKKDLQTAIDSLVSFHFN